MAYAQPHLRCEGGEFPFPIIGIFELFSWQLLNLAVVKTKNGLADGNSVIEFHFGIAMAIRADTAVFASNDHNIIIAIINNPFD